MSEIRPLARGDLQSVADLLVRVFQKRDASASPAMVAYLGELFLDLPDREPDIQSLVYESAAGEVIGFIGTYAQKMRIGDRTVRAAIGNSLVVSPDAGDPTAGARLCRSFFQGPQDLTVSDRSNAITAALWRGMGGTVLPFYSLDWQRILRPTEAVTFKVRRRLKLLGPGTSLLRGVDRALAAVARRRGREVLEAPRPPQRPQGLIRTDADVALLMRAIPDLVVTDQLYPVWSDAALQRQLDQVAHKKELGETIQQVVQDASGRIVGSYIYYLKPHGFAHVLHVLSSRALTGQVLDLLLVDAYERGAFAIGGRAQPRLIECLIERHASFSSVSRCVFNTSDPAILAAVRDGGAVFGGLVGEAWPRLHGDDLR